MKATRNGNGTIDLTGLMEREAFLFTALTGIVSGGLNVSTVWHELEKLFPKYYVDDYHNREFVMSRESGTNVRFDPKVFEDFFRKATRSLTPKVQSKTQVEQRRDEFGRFEKKVWVARFDYPDSSSARYYAGFAKRTVITNLMGKRNPVFDGHSIEGVDLLRGSFRKFLTNKIRGNVKWTKEYKSDVS